MKSGDADLRPARGATGGAERAAELRNASMALEKSRLAALNLMEDALEARTRAEWLARFPDEHPMPVLRVSIGGIVLYRNRATTSFPGWSCEVGETMPPALRPLVAQTVAGGRGLERDVFMSGRTYVVTSTLLPGEHYINLYSHDVTEERAAQLAVETARQEWERTFDSVPDMIAILDADHRVRRANRAMAERHGLTQEQCAGLRCCDLMHGNGISVLQCPHQMTMSDGKDHALSLWVPELRAYFMVTTSPMCDAAGRVVGSVHVARDITAQRMAEQKAQEALALATASRTAVDVLDAMGEGVAIMDMEGRLLSVNPALDRMCGIPADEMTGHMAVSLMESILAPEDRHYTREALRTVLKDRAIEIRAVTIISTDGRTTKVSPSVTFVRGLSEDPTMVVLTLRDISALHEAQRALEESNMVLERMFDTTHVGIVYLDRDFNFVRVNRAYAAGYQCEPEFFAGKNHFEVFPHDENEAIFRRVVATGEEFQVNENPFEFQQHPEWGVTYWDWSLRPIKGEHGSVDSLLLCVLNATERVRARQSLIASESQYQELVDNANSIIMRITPEHNITFFNEFAQKFFGYAAHEVLGRNVLGTITPELDSEGRDLVRMFHEITADPETHASNDNENMRKDGSRVWVHWSNRAVRDIQGRVTELLCVGTDITRRRELETEARRYQKRLKELTDRLASAEEEERWRISRYIHDTIIQNLSLSNMRLGTIEKDLAGIGQEDKARRLREVRELIDAACGQCRTVMSDLTPALLYELGLVPALNDLAFQLEKRHGTRVRVEADGQEPPLARPLRGMLFESARELMTNALKYAGPCEIRTMVNGGRDELVVCVADNGAGFDPKAAEALATNKGGFGLFSIRQRLEGLGGCLEIESAPGKGTRATIRVPVGER